MKFIQNIVICFFLSAPGLVRGAEDLKPLAIPDLLSKLEWAEAPVGNAVCRELLRRGDAALDEVSSLVLPPGKGQDATARFAIHGLAQLGLAPGEDATRSALEKAALRALAKASDPDVKAFFMRQLQLVGSQACVSDLAAYLKDERLCEPATQALLGIGAPGTNDILRKVLAEATGARCITLVRALGVLGDAASTQAILPFASAKEPVLRRVAQYALANSGTIAVADILQQDLGAGTKDCGQAIRLLLLLAKRLGEKGDVAGAETLCETLRQRPDWQAVCGALSVLADIRSSRLSDALVATVKATDDVAREAALRLAEEQAGPEVTKLWIGEAGNAAPEIRGDIATMLGRRGDALAVPFLVGCLSDADAEVRTKATDALAKFGTASALKPLLARLSSPADGDVPVIKGALSRLVGDEVDDQAAAALGKVTPEARSALLDLLAQRGAGSQVDAIFACANDPDRGVRKSALAAMGVVASAADVPRLTDFMLTASSSDQKSTQVIVAGLVRNSPAAGAYLKEKMATAIGKERIALLQTLSRTGNEDALQLVLADTKHAEKDVRNAAVRGLADWPNLAAAPHLLAILKVPEDEVLRVLALRGYVRLAGMQVAGDAAKAAAMLAQAMDLAKNDNDRKLVLGELGSVRTPQALSMAVAALDQEGLKEEASVAVVKIICPRDAKDSGMRSAEAYAALEKVLTTSKNATVTAQAKKHMESFPIGGGSNIALGKPVKTSCPQQGDKAPWKAVDGRLGKLDAWFGDRWPSWYEVDLRKSVMIDGVKVTYYWDGRRYYQYYVEASEDGKTWQKVADNSTNAVPETEKGHQHRFQNPVKARYVRLQILKNSVNEAVHLVEFEVYSKDPAAEKLSVSQITSPDNVALGRPVSISCKQQEHYTPSQAVDGMLDRGHAYWGDKVPSWLQVDLLDVISIDTARVIFHWDGKRYYCYTIKTSKDGKIWQTVADNLKNATPGTAAGIVHRFKPVDARYVRLDIEKNSVNPYTHVVEFEVYAAGKAPKTFTDSTSQSPKVVLPPLPEPDSEGYIPLFNGKDLSGWIGSVNGYAVEDGLLVCKEKGGGKLLTAHQFSDFVLQFDFKMPKGANNGLAIRAPADGNPAYAGMELQIIDNMGYKEVHNYELKPWQVHGSIYGVVPAKTGALKPCGEWNHQEVHAEGDRITVILNGQTIVDADLSKITETADGKGRKGHPGLDRKKGHIGWLGHGARLEFKNIRLKPIEPYTKGPLNVPPEGFVALFNGKDLTGWKGLVANPEKRAAMSAEELAAAQKKADESMRQHWQVVDETLVFDGKGQSLCTAKDYGDFEMFVDWKIKPKGDSGIYLRGSPQVQIWDPASHPEGSGGLYNNQKNPRQPTKCMDNPIGQWNRFRIKMVGECVSVWLNGEQVVENVVMENYWNRKKPIYPSGQIELQNHGNTLYFRNVFLRELTASE